MSITVIEQPSTVEITDESVSLTVQENNPSVTVDEHSASLTVVQAPPATIEIAAPGPQVVGATDSVLLSRTAHGALSGQRIVTPRPDDTVEYADNTNPAHQNAPLWLTTGAVADGGTVTVVAFGPVEESSWSWTPGLLFLGTTGFITQTAPTSPTLFLAVIGEATGTTDAFIDRQPSISLI